MKNNGLIQVLRTFSGKELRELRKWLQSPAHNLRDDVVRLYDFLLEEKRFSGEEGLEKETAFRHIYYRQTYDDAQMRQVIHFLLRVVEAFLTYQELQRDTVQSAKALASVYRRRQLDKFYEKAIREARDIQQEQPFRNGYFLRNEYLLEQERYTYLSRLKRAAPLNLQEASDALDVTFIADKLRQSCEMLSHQTVYKTDYDIGLIREVLAYAEHKNLLRLPAIAIYYYGFKSLTEKENETHFGQLKQQILDHGHLFPPSEIRDIYLMALNYCIGRMNAGKEEYVRQAFELYQIGFEQRIFIENNRVSRYTFGNVILIGLRLKAFQWVESFIQTYQEYLDEKQRDSIVHFSTARLYYEKGDYDKAMRLLSQSDYDDILINLNAKTMLIKMLYEQQEYEVLESLLGSMQTYLQRKDVMGYHKSHYKNIIRFTKKLLRTTPYSKDQKQKLREEILQANPMTEKDWFLRQMEGV